MLEQLTFLSGEPPAKASRSRASAKGLMTPEATSCSLFLQSLNVTGLDGSFGKTCQVSSVQTEDGILVPSSERWLNSGMGSPTEFWTLNGLESPSDVAVCSLSHTLEIGDVQQRYFLSAKACAGILRRAERRGKELPPALKASLEMSAANGPREPEAQPGTSVTTLSQSRTLSTATSRDATTSRLRASRPR